MSGFFRICKRNEADRSRTARFLWLAFLLPTVIGAAGYIIGGIAPFGDNCLLAIDAWGQYFPMLKEMKHALREGFSRSFLAGIRAFFNGWSWSGALGFNRYVQSAYYTSSPLWSILYLLPDNWMIEGVDLLVLFRFGLAGAACYRYLERRGEDGKIKSDKTERKKSVGRLCFSTAYACCAYPLAFIHQFMWLDAYVLFPLVILGLLRLADGRYGERRRKNAKRGAARPGLLCFEYIAPLTLTIISCFYIGYMVCLFCAVYFVVVKLIWRLFKKGISRKDVRELSKSCAVFALNSLTAGGLSAWVWLPSVWALGQTACAEEGFKGALRFYHGFGEMAARFLPFSGVHLAYEAPNLYCGLVCVLLCLAGIVLLVFERIRRWRMPDRDTVKSDGRSFGSLWSSMILTAFLLVSLNLNLLDFVWHGFHYPRQLPGRWSFMPAFLVVSGACLVWEKLLEKRRFGLCAAAALLLVCEILANETFFFMTQLRKVSVLGFTAYDEVMEEVLLQIKKREGNDFYRAELWEPYNFNSGQLYGYPGISYYSSTMTKAAYEFFGALEMPVYALDVSTRYEPHAAWDRLFGVKYLLKPGKGAEAAKKGEDVFAAAVMENPDVWSAGAALCGSLEELNAQWGQKEKTFSRQTDFTRLWDYIEKNMLDEGVWQFVGENCVLGRVSISTEDTKAGAVLLTSIPNDGGWSVRVDGRKCEVRTAFGYLCAVELGTQELESGIYGGEGEREGAREHTVEFRYAVPLLREAAGVSLVFALVIVLRLWYTFFKNMRIRTGGKYESVEQTDCFDEGQGYGRFLER